MRQLLLALVTIAVVLLVASWLTRLLLIAVGAQSIMPPLWLLCAAMIFVYSAMRLVAHERLPRI